MSKRGNLACKENDDKGKYISVIGDINKDGLLNQIDVSLLINHLIGLNGYVLEGLLYQSADIKNDDKVNQIDLTSAIKYVVSGELEGIIPPVQKDVTPPTISLAEQEIYGKQKIKVTAIIKDEESGVQLQKWAKGSKDLQYFKENGNVFVGNEFEVSYNGIYTVYGKDNEGNENIEKIEITKVDSQGPNIKSFEVTQITTRNIAVNVDAEDAQGLSDNETYTYYISKNQNFENAEKIVKNDSSHVFNSLEHGTVYYLKVEIKDSLGNISKSKVLTIETKRISNVNDEMVSDIKWENEKATMTIRKRNDFAVQYKVLNQNGDIINDWEYLQSVEHKIENLYHNYIVIVRLTDLIETEVLVNYGDERRVNILDKNNPIVNLIEQEEFSNEKSVITVNAIDKESGIKSQKWEKGEQDISYFQEAGNEIKNGIFEADENGIYTVYVKDKAGNEVTQTIQVTKINKDKLIINISSIEENLILKKEDSIKLTLKLSKPYENIDESKFVLTGSGAESDQLFIKTKDRQTVEIEIIIGSGNGQLNLQIQEGAFLDDIGNTNDEIIKNNIAVIDNQGPNINEFNVSEIATNYIRVELVSEDVGISGLKEQDRYIYYISENENFENEVSYTTNDTSYTMINLMQNKEYYLKVVVSDNIGNKTTSEVLKVTTNLVPGGADIVQGTDNKQLEFSSESWENAKAKIKITNNSNYYMQYKILNDNNKIIQDWTNVEEKEITLKDLSNKTLVFARLSDSNKIVDGNFGSEVTKQILDFKYPEINLKEQEEVTNSQIIVNAIITDNESGIKVQKWASGIQDEEYFKTQGIEFTGNVFRVNENGMYTVYASDYAGNEIVEVVQVTKQDTSMPAILETKLEGNKSNIIRQGMTLEITCVPNKALNSIDEAKIIITGQGAEGTTKEIYMNENGTIKILVTAGSGNGEVNIRFENGAITDTVGNTNIEQDLNNILIIDNQAPQIDILELISVSISNITIRANAEDIGVAGLAKEDTYEFYISKTISFEDVPIISTNNYYTFKELKQNTTYFIKVIVKDELGNQAQSDILEVRTLDVSNADVEIEGVNWNSGIATLLARSPSEDLNIQYKVMDDRGSLVQDWINKDKESEITNLYHNYTVILRLSASTETVGGNYSQETVYQVKDETAPKLNFLEQEEYSRYRVIFTGSIEENESGLEVQKWAEGSVGEEYFETRGNQLIGNTFSVTENGVYTVYAKDKAGNESIIYISATKIDREGPTVEVQIRNMTDYGFTMEVEAVDRLSGVESYSYYLSDKEDDIGELQETTTQSSYRYAMQKGKTYYVCVIVTDVVGNETMSEMKEVSTQDIPPIEKSTYMLLQDPINETSENGREIELLNNTKLYYKNITKILRFCKK